MYISYKYRIYPSDEQAGLLTKWMGACRFIYNLGLETKIACWVSARKNVSAYDLMAQLTDMRKDEKYDWLRECPRQSLEQSLVNLDKAYLQFFKGSGFPKFKSKNSRQSITFRQDNKVDGKRIRCTKVGWIDIVMHRQLPDVPIKSATITKESTGKYFVSILVDDGVKMPEKVKVSEGSSVGIDLGIRTFATTSDGIKHEPLMALKKLTSRLRVEQRKLSRRYVSGLKEHEQSKGWKKQKMVVAEIFEKIKNQRTDFLHRLSKKVITEYDTICLETLNVAGMVKNRKLSKHISDASWGEFVRQLEYKSEWKGKNILKIGQFEPSSKICSNCGYHNSELKLLDKNWKCNKCGVEHDRDVNAAINIKKMGLKQILQSQT